MPLSIIHHQAIVVISDLTLPVTVNQTIAKGYLSSSW